jgi:lysophospholipase L1-like esterase
MRIAFLGDSLSYRNDWAAALPGFDVRNFGVDGDTTGDVLARLNGVIAAKPDIVFLQIGINDLFRVYDLLHAAARDNAILDGILRSHGKIRQTLTKALPSLRLFVCSLLPVSSELDPRGVVNESIGSLNASLEKEAEKQGLIYVDLHSALRDENGTLAEAFGSDGVHLSRAGYAVWARTIRPCIPRTDDSAREKRP